MSEPDTDLIKCKHGWRPWSIVCVHLVSGSSMQWVEVSFKEDNSDWLCPECVLKDDQANIDNLRPICIDCIDMLRGELDRNYKPTKKGKQ